MKGMITMLKNLISTSNINEYKNNVIIGGFQSENL